MFNCAQKIRFQDGFRLVLAVTCELSVACLLEAFNFYHMSLSFGPFKFPHSVASGFQTEEAKGWAERSQEVASLHSTGQSSYRPKSDSGGGDIRSPSWWKKLHACTGRGRIIWEPPLETIYLFRLFLNFTFHWPFGSVLIKDI